MNWPNFISVMIGALAFIIVDRRTGFSTRFYSFLTERKSGWRWGIAVAGAMIMSSVNTFLIQWFNTWTDNTLLINIITGLILGVGFAFFFAAIESKAPVQSRKAAQRNHKQPQQKRRIK